jgi:hypothetical protein
MPVQHRRGAHFARYVPLLAMNLRDL